MITSKQISTLKYMIFVARNGDELAKRILAFLIDQSKGMTREVCLTLTEGKEGYSAEELQSTAHIMHDMNSSGGTTHLNELTMLMGSKLRFDYHYGDFDPNREGDPFNSDGMFPGVSPAKLLRPELGLEGMPIRYTFWLGKGFYSRKAELVRVTREELEQINLEKPGLYERLEPA